jgi:hypothetical protein
VNLWTVGCADPRLTAQAPPMDKPGKTLRVSPTLPTGRRLPASFTAPRSKKRSIRFRGNGETISRLPAFSLCSPEAVQTTGTVAVYRSPSRCARSRRPSDRLPKGGRAAVMRRAISRKRKTHSSELPQRSRT